MRFSTIVIGTFAALASAQSTSEASSTIASVASSVSSAIVSSTPDAAAAAVLACLDKCSASDVDCRAKCVPVPHPTFEEVEKTQQCVTDCDKNKGNGTEADNTKYGNCVAACIGQNYHSTGPAGAQATNNPSGGQPGASSGAGNNPTSSGGAGNPSNTAGGANQTGTTRPSGAGSLQIGASAMALLGFLAAFANL